MRRYALRVWMVCWLILVWILLWGTVSPANILSGLTIALVITLLLPLPVVPIEGRVHLLSLLRLIGQVAYLLVLSSVQVAWLAVKPGPPPLTAVLRARLAVKSDLVLALGANILTLIPGSIVLEIDQTRSVLYVHVIDVGSDRVRGPVLPPDLRCRTAAGGGLRARHRMAACGRQGERMNTVWIIAAVMLSCGGGLHHVPDTGGAEHTGPAGWARHPRRGDDGRDRHLGGIQPGHHGDLQPDRAGIDQLRRLGQCGTIPRPRHRQAAGPKEAAVIALDIVTAVLVLAGSTLVLTGAIGVVRFPDTLSRMHAATKPQVLGLLLVLVGAAIRLRGNADVGMVILTGLFTLITAPVVGNRVGQLAYREQNIRDDLLTRDEMRDYAGNGETGGNGQD